MGRGSLSGNEAGQPRTTAEPGFFPALTHFTDSINALPKEMIRHYTMLKEVDAKICGPEDVLKKLVAELLDAPVPQSLTQAPSAHGLDSTGTAPGTGVPSAVPSAAASVIGGATMTAPPSKASFNANSESVDIERRRAAWQTRVVMGDMLTVLDEKNHVIATATDALARHLARCESSWSEVPKEISEETCWGNLHHRAYSERAERKKPVAAERPRREAATHHNFAAVVEDSATVRGPGLKRRQQHVDSDFDDPRAPRKGPLAGKGRKPLATANSLPAGNHTSVNPSKRRKVEDTTTALAGAGVERSLSSVFGKGPPAQRAASPRARDTSTVGRRGRGGASTLGTNGAGRRRYKSPGLQTS